MHTGGDGMEFIYPEKFSDIIIFHANCLVGSESNPTYSFSTVGSSGVDFSSKSINYGVSIFEGGGVDRTANGRTFSYHMDLNFRRMIFNAENSLYGYPQMPLEEHMLALANVIYMNGFDQKMRILAEDGSVHVCNGLYIRPLMYLGPARNIVLRNLYPFQYTLIAFPQVPYHGKNDTGKGMVVLFLSERKKVEHPERKLGENYPSSMRAVRKMIALRERLIGTDPGNADFYARLNEVVWKNLNGYPVEGSAENIAILKGNTLITPRIEDGALPGLTMQLAEIAAQELGYKTRRGVFTTQEIRNCDMMIMTGNAAGLVLVDGGITEDNNERFEIGTQKGREAFAKLKALYQRMRANEFTGASMGAYADEFVSESDIRELREKAMELRAINARLQAAMKGEVGSNGDVSFNPQFKINAPRLIGSVPPDFQTRLPPGRKLSQEAALVKMPMRQPIPVRA
jgi:branched-subunit amino acid aminotransferase/4-amino-4-deoxychorismate lyase